MAYESQRGNERMVTGVITIVKELPQKIWNSIVGAVTKVATWGNNMLTKAKEVMNAW